MTTEREQFEAWAKVRYAKNPHFWLRQIDDGGYSCGMADSAWEAWQAARAQPAQAVPVLTDAEIEPLAVAHEAFGFGRVDSHGLTTHGFDPDGLRSFVNAIEQAVRAKMLGKEGA